MDKKDLKILRELERNARKSSKAIGKAIGLHPDVVRYRIDRLVKQNIIASFLTFVNFAKIGFVDYPAPLAALFNLPLFKDGIRFMMSLLTFLALLYLVRFIWSSLKYASSDNKKPDEPTILLFCMLALIIAYTTLHSFFFVITRYILPIAPLYLIIITFSLEKIVSRGK